MNSELPRSALKTLPALMLAALAASLLPGAAQAATPPAPGKITDCP